MPRKYTKRSEYWEKFNKKNVPIENLLNPQEDGFSPELIGEPIFSSSEASRLTSPTARTKARTNAVATLGLDNKFENIKDLNVIDCIGHDNFVRDLYNEKYK